MNAIPRKNNAPYRIKAQKNYAVEAGSDMRLPFGRIYVARELPEND